MTSLSTAVVALALTAGDVHLYDPPKVDATPSAYACTAESLARGELCTFEGVAGPSATAADNLGRAKSLAETTCAQATRDGDGSKALHDACVARLQSAAEACAVDGALFDKDGRFTESAKRCYRALAEARVKAESLANAAPSCCACLAQNHCGGGDAACVDHAVHATLSATCAGDACGAECAELFAGGAAPAAPAKPTKKKAK